MARAQRIMAEYPEATVVHELKKHLLADGLRGSCVGEVIVDADPSYRASRHAKALEPMASVAIDGFRPDLLCSTRSGTQTLISAFEVKPRLGEWPKGLAQARAYRSGVHHSYLALPYDKGARIGQLERDALESGIGVLILDKPGWREVVAPANPRPLPWTLQSVAAILEGVPSVRRLLLNHPLNYLVVAYLRFMEPEVPLVTLLEAHWPDLRTENTRAHAMDGARILGLIDREGCLTPLGNTAVDLLEAVGFDPKSRPNKRIRLAEAAPAVAAITRSILLGLPSVRLLIETLRETKGGSLRIIQLLQAARRRDEVLAGAFFLITPEAVRSELFRGEDFSSTMVYQFKQILWHSGILATKADRSAGRGGETYRPDDDVWTLESRLMPRA